MLTPHRVWLTSLTVLTLACGARSSLDALGERAPGDPDPFCGDAVLSATEACDVGADVVGDDCLADCQFAYCGDGEQRPGEVCDDGNNQDGDGCEADCSLPSCGDGVVDSGEECDGGSPAECTPNCTFPVCGDGFLAPNEECDDGAQNGITAALSVVWGAQSVNVTPIVLVEGVAAFYDFSSASSHTGFEQAHLSSLFCAFDSAGLHLVTIHNIDQGVDGVKTGNGEVNQRFSGLPQGAAVEVADDRAEEFSLTSDGSVVGNWKFQNNTDGGVIGPLTFPGDWVIQVDSNFIEGIDRHEFIDAQTTLDLELTPTVSLVARSQGSGCRPDCLLPRCGDGFVDAGEVCDDGDPASGVCNADCSGPNP